MSSAVVKELPENRGICASDLFSGGVTFGVDQLRAAAPASSLAEETGEHHPDLIDSDDNDAHQTLAGDSGGDRTYFSRLARLAASGHSLTSWCLSSSHNNNNGDNGEEDSVDEDDEEDNDQLDVASTPFATLRGRMRDLVGDGGVMKLVLRPGAGVQVPAGSRALLHYVAHLEAHDEPFDSTYMRAGGRPRSHLVGPISPLIAGLNMGVLSMCKGEECLLLIRHEYAFGKMGCGPRIPPEAEVLFKVVVVSWTDNTDIDQFNDLSVEQRDKVSFSSKMTTVRGCQVNGNEHYKQADYRAACRSYRQAINIFLDSMSFKNSDEQEQAEHVIFKIMSNRTQALLCLNQWKEAAKQGHQALIYSKKEDNAKYILYLRLAKAMIYVPELDEAAGWLRRAAAIRPRGTDLHALMQLMQARAKHSQLKEVEFARKALQNDVTQEDRLSSQGVGADVALDSVTNDDVNNDDDDADESSLVSPSFRQQVDEMLTEFRDNAEARELNFPFDRSEEAALKMAHVRRCCRRLGLVFVAASDISAARVVKP